MARLSRTESQAQTRKQLLATARELFFADGYVQTSLEKVADAAGYSKGAVYSNFRNKIELCTAVLDEVRAERIEEVMAIIALDSAELQMKAFDEWARRVVGDPGWTSLEVEFVSNTRRNEDVRDALGDRLDSIVNLMAAGIDASGVDTRLPGHETALTLLALGTGLGLFRSINPSIPVDGLIDTMKIILRKHQ
ncbi:TetR/AcrR family transcriptional regulator [Smaragdicoccus niigatensis]|uniref:TetR/AcrR family transcriptional regulator n=1 Tax=Smaragdicoccus niigatensis TaxID=359359 RepID=UPI0003672D22|nr:TetR/AcrR family transcriptional regulator [Smaragdicoccus niigatensis]